MSFDIGATAAQACEAGHTFEPTFPDSTQGIGATITVRGPYSQAVMDYEQRQLEQSHQRALAARKEGRAYDPPNVDALVEASIAKAAVATLGWSGITRNGAALEFSPEHALAVYRAHPWLAVQVNDTAALLGKFIGPSKPSSSSTPAPSSSST
jgi:hypothetical protein